MSAICCWCASQGTAGHLGASHSASILWQGAGVWSIKCGPQTSAEGSFRQMRANTLLPGTIRVSDRLSPAEEPQASLETHPPEINTSQEPGAISQLLPQAGQCDGDEGVGGGFGGGTVNQDEINCPTETCCSSPEVSGCFELSGLRLSLPITPIHAASNHLSSPVPSHSPTLACMTIASLGSGSSPTPPQVAM